MSSSWINIRLGDIADFSNGINFSHSDYTGDVKLIGVSHFGERFFPDYSILDTISEKVVSAKDELHDGDIIFVRSNGNKDLVGRCMLISNPPCRVTYSGFCIRARIKNKDLYNPAFLAYHFKTQQFRKTIAGTSRGANIQNLNQRLLSEYVISIPSKEEQDKIVGILSNYDNLIMNHNRQIDCLEEMLQRIFKEWFIDYHFPGFESTTRSEGMPDGWKKMPILNCPLFQFSKSRITQFENEKDYFATADVDGTYLIGNGERISYSDRPSRAQIQPSPFSVWFARMSNSYKILGFVNSNEWRRKQSILSTGFAGFETSYDLFAYMYCLISSKWFDDQKNRFATGSTQVSLTNEGLSKINVLVPSKEIVKLFSKECNEIIERIVVLRESCFKLAEARDLLLPRVILLKQD